MALIRKWWAKDLTSKIDEIAGILTEVRRLQKDKTLTKEVRLSDVEKRLNNMKEQIDRFEVMVEGGQKDVEKVQKMTAKVRNDGWSEHPTWLGTYAQSQQPKPAGGRFTLLQLGQAFFLGIVSALIAVVALSFM